MLFIFTIAIKVAITVYEVMMNLGRLRQIIDSRGLKHKVLARQVNMHPSVFSRALKGEKKFEQEKFDLLLKILKIKPEALMKSAS